MDNELPQGEGPLNRDGNPKHPPSQRIVTNWPVLDLRVQPKIELEDWSLTISGLVDRPKMFSWDAFMSLPQVEDVSDFHCVTSWSRLNNRWRESDLWILQITTRSSFNAKFVYIKAYDAYSTNHPLIETMKPDGLLVHQWEGVPLTTDHGDPVKMITPQLYAW